MKKIFILFFIVFVVSCGDDDNKSSEHLEAFTTEIIAGDYSWRASKVIVERGSSNSVKESRTIKFYSNGTCEGFHSMEDGWRINNGKIETYYKRTNEPIFVYTLLSVKGNELTVRINGTLDDNLQAKVLLTKELIPEQVPVEEFFFESKEHVISALNGCYIYCMDFIKNQLALESIRTSKDLVHTINPSTPEISKTWQSAYKTIQLANVIVNSEKAIISLLQEHDGQEVIAEATAIRAFVYYNIAMLWGSVPFVSSIDIDVKTVLKSQADIYDFSYNEIKKILPKLTENGKITNGKYAFSPDAGLMLLTELEMSQDNDIEANQYRSEIYKQKYEGVLSSVNMPAEKPVIWALVDSEKGIYYPVYTYSHILLYEKELSITAIDVNSEWLIAPYIKYGYWAALKRLCIAEKVTGCYDYELLMPYPYIEVVNNPEISQNAGY